MAECNISRCSHERRVFRRELHKWSKEILYILGLERLAEELMGTWKWKILVQPFTDLESKSPVDWYPEETCYFCCAKKQPPYDPASGIIPTIDSYNSIRLDTDDHSTSSDQVKLSEPVLSSTSTDEIVHTENNEGRKNEKEKRVNTTASCSDEAYISKKHYVNLEPVFPSTSIDETEEIHNKGKSAKIKHQECLSESESIVKRRPVKGRKRKYSEQSRTESQKKRNSNEVYIDYKGRKREPKGFINFDCKCKLKCPELISLELRKGEFERFWSLGSYNNQSNYIAGSVLEIPKKRNYGINTEKRQYSRTYNIAGKVVCREMFVKTLGISSCRVNTSLKKFHGRMPLLDQRGIQQGGKNKIPDDRVKEVIEQLNKVPKYISDYSPEKTNAKFLPPDVTLSKMYKMYSTECENPVSYTKYKKIFYSNFNLRTKPLKKDAYNISDSLKMQIDDKKQEFTENIDKAENT